MIFCLFELPLEPSSKGKTSWCGSPKLLQVHSVLLTAASFVMHLIALTTEQQGKAPAPAPSTQSTSGCCPHPHSFHGQKNATKKKTESLYDIKVLNFSSSNDICKKVERQTRVGENISNTYN